MRLLLGFWDTPVPSAGATPDEHPKGTRFNGAGGAGRFPQMNADCNYALDTGCFYWWSPL